MIDTYSFGRIVIDGKSYSNDVKIVNGTVIPDWRRKKGHFVDVNDISDILEAGPSVIIIGTGDSGLLRASEEVGKTADKQGVRLIEEKTGRAVEIFNEMAKTNSNIAAGFHLTC